MAKKHAGPSTKFVPGVNRDKLLGSVNRDKLVNEYVNMGIPLDQLPHTDAFSELHSRVVASMRLSQRHHVIMTKADLWRTLNGIRKSGMLPSIKKAPK